MKISISNTFIIIFILTFFLSFILPNNFVQENLFFSLNNALNARFHTAVTALFMHGSYFHLAMNSLFLFFFGNELERKIGKKRFLFLFLLVGVSSFLLSSPSYNYNQLLVGASASIFGVMSCLAIVNPLFLKKMKRVDFIFGNEKQITSKDEKKILDSYSFFINLFIFIIIQITLISFYKGIVQESQVSDLGHVIGFLQGAFFGILWSSQWKKFFQKNLTKLILGVLILILIVYVLVLVSSFFTTSNPFFKSQAEKCVNYCVSNGYTNGKIMKGVCECFSNITIHERIN